MEIASRDAAYIDLHIHSTASDGSLSPLEIVEAAKKINLRAIAITDHDTLDGSAEACTYCETHSIEILSGLEISANYPPGTMHILGYLVRIEDGPLRQTLRIVQEARASRNVKIIEKLRALGINMHYDEVLEVAGEGQIGRPHIAQVLVDNGTVQTVDEAFNRFLRKGGPAYASRYRLLPGEAVQLILQAGGVPVLAHPFTLNAKDEAELEGVLVGLKQAGLRGVEVYYPDHRPERRAQYEHLALRHDLLMTGGTDFHGWAKPGVYIGIGRGDLRVPYQLVDELKKRRP